MYVQIHLGGNQNPQKQKKRRFVLITSLLFLLSVSDMLTKVSVIFSLCESDIKSFGLSDILFAPKLAKQISLGVSRITLRSNRTRRRRIELRDTPSGVSRIIGGDFSWYVLPFYEKI